ncbi:MAG: restriction endonuclease subunit S [Eubacteriales bacterium]|nr:restriction endonuclease subunit S [Eubacteriales bacterium]
MKFKEIVADDLIDEIAMGPFGSNVKKEFYVESGIPILNGSNLIGYVLNEDSFGYLTEEKADSLKKANAYRGDVVITHRGTLGQAIFIPQDSKYERYVISQSQFRIRCNEKIMPEYMVYFLHTPIGQHRLLANASQVGVPALGRPSTTFRQILFNVPELEVQKKVVSILESIRKKIENNNQINRNLSDRKVA